MNTTQNAPVAQSTPTIERKTPAIGDFGNGRYSLLAKEVFGDSQRVFKLSEEKSDKLTRLILTDFGIVNQSAKVKIDGVKMGKVSDDNKCTIGEAASKVKGVTLTNPLWALKALCFAGQAGKNGFIMANTKWAVNQQLEEFFTEL